LNLCPCGARGDPGAECSCSAQRLAAYRDKLSRALLDRFDLVIAVPRPRSVELAAGPGEASEHVAERVVSARELLAVAPLRRTTETDELLTRAVDALPLSGRGRARVARVARTIAALAGAEEVRPDHLGRSARLPRAAGARDMNELALAVFASETGTHLIRPPIGSRWAAHLRAFDARAYEQAARCRRLSLPRAVGACVSAAAACHSRPAAGPVPARARGH